MTLLLIFLIGFFTGLRSLTPAAVVAWATRLGWLKLAHPFSLIGSLPSVIIFTVLALAELVADKLPNTPSRTAPPGLIARIVMGALAGGCIGLAGGLAAISGAAIGAVSAIIGCFAGYQVRARTVKALGCPDYYIAVCEDLVTIAGSLWVASRF